MDAEELKIILANHDVWRRGEAGGVRANFRDADLRYADLRGVDLVRANLCEANLVGANLSEADLRDANLKDANLSEADLRYADLRGAYLFEANLRRANFREANLLEANLSGAYLEGALSLVCLDMHDPRGYTPVAVTAPSGWQIFSGCRAFTVAEALVHWGELYQGNRGIGDRYLRAIRALPDIVTEENG